MKKLTFEELVDKAVISIHLALLTDGGKGMQSEIYKWMSKAIEWSMDKKEK
jgi:hypothetical protein